MASEERDCRRAFDDGDLDRGRHGAGRPASASARDLVAKRTGGLATDGVLHDRRGRGRGREDCSERQGGGDRDAAAAGLGASFDDCWEATLSDDENAGAEASRDWRTSIRQWQTRRRDSRTEVKCARSNSCSDGTPNKRGSLSSEGSVDKSLPEQLLKQRLRRKARMHRKHEQFVRYQQQQQQQQQQQGQQKQKCHPRDPRKGVRGSLDRVLATPPQGKKSCADHLHVLTASPRPSSPLFLDEGYDNDNASTVASSNGASDDAAPWRTPCKSNGHGAPDTATSPLASLPQHRVRALPDEADRKRLVGCLAGVLASAYAHEAAPHLLVKEGRTAGPDVGTEANGADATEGASDAADGAHPSLRHHVRQQEILRRSRSTADLRAGAPPPAPNSLAARQSSFQFASFNNNASAARIFENKAPPTAVKKELAEIRHQIRRHAVLSELLTSSAEMLMLDASHARAFLPLLDGLLAKVKVPENAENRTLDGSNPGPTPRQSWKGRGFGGGGVLGGGGPAFGMANKQRDEDNTVRSASISTHGTGQTAQAMPAPSPLPLDEQPSKLRAPGQDAQDVSKPHTMVDDNPKPGDLYEPFPSSLEGDSPCDKKSASLEVESSDNDKPAVFPSPSTPLYAPLDTVIVESELVAPFLQTLTPGAGFRCIALLIVNHLLRDGRGYDARVRQAFKRLAVIVLSHELKVGGILRADLDDEEGYEALWDEETKPSDFADNREEFDDADELARLATRKFEAMEHAIAAKLIAMSGRGAELAQANGARGDATAAGRSSNRPSRSPSTSAHGRIALAPREAPAASSRHSISQDAFLRGLKVGAAGAVGATLFALTGGLVAPGIAAGLAAVGK